MDIRSRFFSKRPGCDVQMMRDGSLLVSDDWNGAIYRVSYGNAKAAHAR